MNEILTKPILQRQVLVSSLRPTWFEVNPKRSTEPPFTTIWGNIAARLSGCKRAFFSIANLPTNQIPLCLFANSSQFWQAWVLGGAWVLRLLLYRKEDNSLHVTSLPTAIRKISVTHPDDDPGGGGGGGAEAPPDLSASSFCDIGGCVWAEFSLTAE